jgi:hypothetical protein
MSGAQQARMNNCLHAYWESEIQGFDDSGALVNVLKCPLCGHVKLHKVKEDD